MKLNILHILGVATTLLAASCAQEELQKTDTEKLAELAVSVTDGGYISEDTESDAPTRITDNDYRTEFTAGDACGLYIVRDGKIIAENIKLTAAGTGSNVTWNTDAGVELFGGLVDEDYYLYYPYQESMDGKISPAATTDAEFFAPLIKDWQPQADQSDYETGYAASDLMTAEGRLERNGDTFSLNFNMYHRMSLVIIELDKTVYNFTNKDPALPPYVIPTPVEFKGEYLPYITEEVSYRYIVNLNADNDVEIKGSYENGNKIFTLVPANISSGSYKTYLVDNAVITRITDHYLQPGDFFMSDGSLVKKGTSLSEEQKNDCVGVVFYAGHNPEDGMDYSDTGIGKVKCNGYVMAVKNLPKAIWQNIANDRITNTDTDWWDGFYNYVWGLSPISDCCPIYNTVMQYVPAAPSKTTKWYLPSIAQLVYIFSIYEKDLKQSVEYFNKNFIGPYYWSSTTASGRNGQAEAKSNVLTGEFIIVSFEKTTELNVCPILSF